MPLCHASVYGVIPRRSMRREAFSQRKSVNIVSMFWQKEGISKTSFSEQLYNLSFAHIMIFPLGFSTHSVTALCSVHDAMVSEYEAYEIDARRQSNN